MFRGNLLGLVYLVIGVVVAADKNYFENVDKLKHVVELILAVLLWPLVLLGVDMTL